MNKGKGGGGDTTYILHLVALPVRGVVLAGAIGGEDLGGEPLVEDGEVGVVLEDGVVDWGYHYRFERSPVMVGERWA